MYEERLGFQGWQEKQQALVNGVRDHADKVRRKTVLVVRFDAKTRSFYQDRLGANLGKNSKKVPFVL
jgi:hypothetical protein